MARRKIHHRGTADTKGAGGSDGIEHRAATIVAPAKARAQRHGAVAMDAGVCRHGNGEEGLKVNSGDLAPRISAIYVFHHHSPRSPRRRIPLRGGAHLTMLGAAIERRRSSNSGPVRPWRSASTLHPCHRRRCGSGMPTGSRYAARARCRRGATPIPPPSSRCCRTS